MFEPVTNDGDIMSSLIFLHGLTLNKYMVEAV